MAPKETCGAHEMFVENMKNVQMIQQKISDEVAENNVRTAVMELEVKTMTESFKAFLVENERQQTNLNERIDKLFIVIQTEKSRQKLRPGHYVAMMVAFITSAGLVISTVLSKGAKL